MKFLGKTPEIEISPMAYQKMMAYTEASEKSIGWIMEISEYEGSVFIIEDAFLIPQKVNYTEAILDKKFYDELDTSKTCYSGIGFSTCNSTVVPTTGDMSRFETITSGLSWYIGAQMNKKGEFNLFFVDKQHQVMFDKIDWSYGFDVYMTKEEAKEDISKFVSTTYGTSYNTKSYSGQTSYYDTYLYKTPTKEYPPSELATKKPDISSLV